MPRHQWRLSAGRPVIEVDLTDAMTGGQLTRLLLADTGGGDMAAAFDVILHEDDCMRCVGRVSHRALLGGALSGQHLVYALRAQIPGIGFDDYVHAVAVSDTQTDFDGIACF